MLNRLKNVLGEDIEATVEPGAVLPLSWAPALDSCLEIKVEEGQSKGRTVSLDSAFMFLGRETFKGENRPGWLLFAEPSISRRQALLAWDPEAESYRINHMPAATNQTLVNGHVMTESFLRPGNYVKMGLLGFRLKARPHHGPRRADGFVGQALNKLGCPQKPAAPVRTGGWALTVRGGPGRGQSYFLTKTWYALSKGPRTGPDDAAGALHFADPSLADPQAIMGWVPHAQAYVLVPNPQASVPTVLERPGQDGVAVRDTTSLQSGDLITMGSVRMEIRDDLPDLLAEAALLSLGMAPAPPVPSSASPSTQRLEIPLEFLAAVQASAPPAIEPSPPVSPVETSVQKAPRSDETVYGASDWATVTAPPEPRADQQGTLVDVELPDLASLPSECVTEIVEETGDSNATLPAWGVGDKILGRYEVLGVASGGMATVYFTYDEQWKVPFAIKGLRAELAADREARNRFYREAQLWVKLGRHPFIVTAEMAQVVEGQPWLFLEYLDGGDLASKLAEGPLTLEQTLLWSIQICLGVGDAYSALGLVHRDIKPSNALLTVDGDVKVTDFGIARSVRQETFSDGGVTREGGISGTLAYMSPEAFSAPDEVDTRSDIYAFGCMLFEMLTGSVLFTGKNLAEHVMARFSGEVNLEKFPALANVYRPVLDILQRCVRQSPSERFEDFGELSRALQDVYQQVVGKAFKLPTEEPDDSPNAYHNRGISLANLGFHRDAIEWYQKALRLYPDMTDTRVALGESLLNMGSAAEALDAFREAVAADLSGERSRVGLAQALEAFNDAEGAMAQYRALAESPHYGAQVRSMAINLLERLGRTEEANQWRSMASDRPHVHGAPQTSEFHAGFRTFPRSRHVPRIQVRRGRLIAEGFCVEVRGEEVLVAWPHVVLVQLGSVREDSPATGWHYVLDVHTHGQLYRFDGRSMGFLAFLGKSMVSSESMNLVLIMERFYELVPRCRFSPSKRDISRAGPLAISRYQSLKNFDQHGNRLLVMPHRA